jgi:hypothetical protein
LGEGINHLLTLQEKHMKLLSTTFKALVICNMAVFATFPAYAGSSEDAMEASLHQYQLAAQSTEWQNVWMPKASANAVAVGMSGDQQMGQIVASYSRSNLDRGGWENTLMTNSNYTATNPLMAVGVGSGATSPMPASMKVEEHLAQL